MLRVLTWNVARRRSRLAEQAAALAQREPDVVGLQEITAGTLPLWRAAFETIGLPHVRASLDRADPDREPASRRRTGVVIASREEAAEIPAIPAPWPETATAVRVPAKGSLATDVHCIHVPNAANGWVKIRTLEAVRSALAAGSPARRILCGDLNTPRRELPDGSVISFARDSGGRLRSERGSEWDEGELGVVPGLRDVGYRDAFREVNGYESREPSWTWRVVAGHGGGWRLDHVFASNDLRPVAAQYHHSWRDQGLSDHSPLEVDLE